MSLLDDGPDEVQVWPEIAGTDDDGNPTRVPGSTPVSLRGRVQPVAATESAALGQTGTTVYRLIARDFPGGAYARVAWGGRDWDVIGEPLRSRGSRATRHVKVLLSARAPEGL